MEEKQTKSKETDITSALVIFFVILVAIMIAKVAGDFSKQTTSTNSRASVTSSNVITNAQRNAGGDLSNLIGSRIVARIADSKKKQSVNDPIGAATVILGKVKNSQGEWVGHGGFLYSSNKIVTVKHSEVDESWFYTFGPNFLDHLCSNTNIVYQYDDPKNTNPIVVFRDIDHVVFHNDLDLAVIILKSPSMQLPVPLADSVSIGSGNTTIGQVRSYSWIVTPNSDVIGLGKWDVGCLSTKKSPDNKKCVQSIDANFYQRFWGYNDINTTYPDTAIIATTIGIAQPGDCGAPVIQDNKVIGYSFGVMKHGYADSGKNLSVNITDPLVKAWIENAK